MPKYIENNSMDSIRKLKIANDLFEFAFKIKMHQISKAFPSLSEQELKKKTMNLLDRDAQDIRNEINA